MPDRVVCVWAAALAVVVVVGGGTRSSADTGAGVAGNAATGDAVAAQAGAAPRAATSPAAPAGRADVGATLYRKVACFMCHVNEAQGGANGPRLGPDPIPFARFLQYVRKPAGDMPPYTSKVLSDEDLADIYAFLQSRAKPPAVNTIPLLAR